MAGRAFVTAERIPVIRATAMPTHLNPYGGVFGGWLISQMALGAGSEASRVVRGKAVLVAADELRFKGAPSVGDEVSVYVELLESGRTSLTYQAEAISRERHGDAETRVAWGRFKFVALDDRGLQAQLRRADRGHITTRAGAEHHDVVRFSHWSLPARPPHAACHSRRARRT